VLVVWFAVISDHLESSDHLTHSEKSQNLSKDDPGRSQLLGVDVADGTEERFRVDRASHGAHGRTDGSWVPEHVDQRLEV